MRFSLAIILQVLAISAIALPIDESVSMPPPIGAIAGLIGKEAPLIAKEAPKIGKEIPKIIKEVPKITKTRPKLTKELEKALSKLSHGDCDKIVTLLKQSGVHVDNVANKLHLPKDVVEAAWDVFQATGKCSG